MMLSKDYPQGYIYALLSSVNAMDGYGLSKNCGEGPYFSRGGWSKVGEVRALLLPDSSLTEGCRKMNVQRFSPHFFLYVFRSWQDISAGCQDRRGGRDGRETQGHWLVGIEPGQAYGTYSLPSTMIPHGRNIVWGHWRYTGFLDVTNIKSDVNPGNANGFQRFVQNMTVTTALPVHISAHLADISTQGYRTLHS
jgi:hypothetical protein